MRFPFKKSKKEQTVSKSYIYDPALQKPILRCSICTGEQVAGFRDLHTGKFQDIMLIRNENDLQSFREQYKIPAAEKIEKEY